MDAAVIGIGLAVQSLTKPDTYEVGQCVKVIEGTIDQDLKPTSCVSSDTYLDPTYCIDEVLDGSASTCSYYDYDVQFQHEPHDKTYCLNTYYDESYYGE